MTIIARCTTLLLLIAAGACSSGSSAPPSGAGDVEPPPAAPNGNEATLFTFEGRVDVVSHTMTLTTRGPSGRLVSESTLPYGTAAGDVYFHTCGAPAYSLASHTLTASVQAVNLMTGPAVGMTAVIDAVVPSTVTPASGTIATYGNVSPNAASNCGTPNATWTFTDPSDASFTFSGHASGTATLFYDDFSGLSSSYTGTQCSTGDTVYAYATVPQWTPAGENAIHGVAWQPGNLAAQLYGGDSNGQQNSLTMKTGIENVSGKSYTVSFLGGPGNWNTCGQGTTANNDLVFKVSAGATVLKTFTYQPAIWSGTETFSAASFTYTGNGNGSSAVLSITAGGTAFGTFGGAVDNVQITSP